MDIKSLSRQQVALIPTTGQRHTGEHAPLVPVSTRPQFVEYLRQIWDRRHFIKMQAYSQATNQHQGSLLGNLWMIIAPLLDGAVYWFIFGYAFKAGGRGTDFLPRLIVGVLLFSFASRCLTGCAGCLRGSMGLIRAFSFPRASIPLAIIIKEIVAQVPSFIVMLLLIVLIKGPEVISFTWLLSALPSLIMATCVAGFGFVFARIGFWLADTQKLIPYGLRMLMYGSGVIFTIDRFTKNPDILYILELNPVYLFIEMTRSLVMYNTVPSVHDWFVLSAWGIGALTLGILFFWQAEVSYGRERKG